MGYALKPALTSVKAGRDIFYFNRKYVAGGSNERDKSSDRD